MRERSQPGGVSKDVRGSLSREIAKTFFEYMQSVASSANFCEVRRRSTCKMGSG